MKLVIIFILSFMTFSTAIAQDVASSSYILTEVKDDNQELTNGLPTKFGVRFIRFSKFAFVVNYEGVKFVKVFWKGKYENPANLKISKIKFYPMLKGDKRSKELIIFTTGEELTIWYNQDGTVSGYHFIHYKWADVSGQVETEEGVTSNN